MNTISEQTMAALLRAFNEGHGIRAAARFAGVVPVTARRVWATLDPKPLCKCGRPATHRGWCRQRFAASPKRQEFIRNWPWKGKAKHRHTVRLALHVLKRQCAANANLDGERAVDKVLMDLFGTTAWP